MPRDLQEAHIRRDVGFTSTREGVATRSQTPFASAAAEMERSLALTEKYLGDVPDPETVSAYHGATLGVIARTATAQCVVLREQVTPAIDEAYEAAHQRLEQGNNAYFLASNAMAAARNARLTSGFQGIPSLYVLRWLKRATEGVLRAAVHDPHNLAPALGAFARGVFSVRTKKAAEDSVLARP